MKQKIEENGEKWDEKKWLRYNWQRDLVSLYGKSLTSGMEKQCSMSAALAEMGFYTEKGKGTAQQQFEEAVRHDLQDFAEKYGIKIDRSLGRKHSHMEKDLFQKSQENDRKSSELNSREKKVIEFEKDIKKASKEIDESFKKLETLETYNSLWEKRLAKQHKEQTSKETELNVLSKNLNEQKIRQEKKEKELNNREWLAQMKDENNNSMREQINAKKLELSEREKTVIQKEAPLKQRESIVLAKEAELLKREEGIVKQNYALKIREAELSKNQKAFNLRENDIIKREKDFEMNKEKVQSYATLESEVVKHHLTFDSAVKSFYEDTESSIRQRMNKFVFKCKAVVVTLANELHRYTNAFKNLWKATPTYFRNLAAKMEKESCQTYEEYEQKRRDGKLSEQIEERKRINDEYEKRKNKINRDYSGYSR